MSRESRYAAGSCTSQVPCVVRMFPGEHFFITDCADHVVSKMERDRIGALASKRTSTCRVARSDLPCTRLDMFSFAARAARFVLIITGRPESELFATCARGTNCTRPPC